MFKEIQNNGPVSRGLFFQFGFACYVIQALSKITYFGTDVINLSFFSVFVLLFCLLQEVFANRRTRESYTVLVLFALLTLAQHVTGGRNLLALFVLVFTARSLPIRRVLQTMLVLLCISLAATVLMAKLGIITNMVAYRENSSLARYGLGFIGWTYSSYFLFVITAVYALLEKESVRLSAVGVLFVANLWIYVQTNTRNGFFLTLFVLAALCIIKCVKCGDIKNAFPQKRVVAVVISSVFVLAFLLLAVLVSLYQFGGGWVEAIDKVMSYRLRYTSEAFQDFGISLFGTAVNWDQVSYIVDISYFRVALEYGVISALVMVALLTFATWSFVSRGELLSTLICFAFAVFYSFDPVMATAFLNPLVFIGAQIVSSFVVRRGTEACASLEEACKDPDKD